MGRRTTNIYDKKEEFKSFFEKIGAQLGTSYKSKIDSSLSSLNTLIDDTDSLYDNGKEYSMMTRVDFVLEYKSLATELGKIEKALTSDTNLDSKVRRSTLDQLHTFQKLVAEDMYLVEQTRNVNDVEYIGDAIEAVQPPLATIDKENLGSAGELLSSRIPITIKDEKGKEIKGFFTPNSNYDPLVSHDEILDKLEKQYGKTAEPLLGLLRASRSAAEKYAKKKGIKDFKATDEKVFDFLVDDALDLDIFKVTPKSLYTTMNKILGKGNYPSVENLVIEYKLADDEKREINTSNFSDFEKAFLEYANALKGISTQKNIYGNIGVKVGDNIDKRNVSMSMVSSILGVPNLLAPAKQVGLMINGKEVSGTFMPNAQGMDIHNPTEEDRKRDALSACLGKPGFRDLADLQVVDYICGNIDRHLANLMYKFDEKGDFIGVQGIDNDASFGLNVPTENRNIGRTPALKDFMFISESMYFRISGLNSETLNTQLRAQGLSDSEVKASCLRLEKLQNYIAQATPLTNAELKDINAGNKHSFDGLRIVKDDDFKEIDFIGLFVNHLKAKNAGEKTTGVDNNYFSYPINAIQSANNSIYQRKEFDQPIAKVSKATEAKKMDKNAADFQLQLTALQKVDKWYIRSSPEFRALRTSLESLFAFTDGIKNPPLKIKDAKQFSEKLNVLQNCTKDYIEKKSVELGKSAYADSRLRFARGLKKFVDAKKLEFAERIVNEIGPKKEKTIAHPVNVATTDKTMNSPEVNNLGF